MTDSRPTGGRGARILARFNRRRTVYHCKACGEYFPRAKPYCPICKTRKGGRGQPVPPGAGLG